MKLNIQNVTIKDVIALITVIGGLFLVSQGINGTIGTVLVMVVSFYFGHFRNHR